MFAIEPGTINAIAKGVVYVMQACRDYPAQPEQSEQSTGIEAVVMPQAWKCAGCSMKFQIHCCPSCGGTRAARTAPRPVSKETAGSLALEWGSWAQRHEPQSQEQQHKCPQCHSEYETSAAMYRNERGEPTCPSCGWCFEAETPEPQPDYVCQKCGSKVPPDGLRCLSRDAVHCPSCGRCSASEAPIEQPEPDADAPEEHNRCTRASDGTDAPEPPKTRSA